MSDRCALCTEKVQEGQAVEHEMGDGRLFLFCTMRHFKTWVAERRNKGLSVK